MVGGARRRFLVLRNQARDVRRLIAALAAGFLIITVTQSMIPEANRGEEPRFALMLYLDGLSLYQMIAVAIAVAIV